MEKKQSAQTQPSELRIFGASLLFMFTVYLFIRLPQYINKMIK